MMAVSVQGIADMAALFAVVRIWRHINRRDLDVPLDVDGLLSGKVERPWRGEISH